MVAAPVRRLRRSRQLPQQPLWLLPPQRHLRAHTNTGGIFHSITATATIATRHSHHNGCHSSRQLLRAGGHDIILTVAGSDELPQCAGRRQLACRDAG
jgi:hypothetical protein